MRAELGVVAGAAVEGVQGAGAAGEGQLWRVSLCWELLCRVLAGGAQGWSSGRTADRVSRRIKGGMQKGKEAKRSSSKPAESVQGHG
eukprot:1150344-Pelagomonas_calceolata.AAC.5